MTEEDVQKYLDLFQLAVTSVAKGVPGSKEMLFEYGNELQSVLGEANRLCYEIKIKSPVVDSLSQFVGMMKLLQIFGPVNTYKILQSHLKALESDSAVKEYLEKESESSSSK